MEQQKIIIDNISSHFEAVNTSFAEKNEERNTAEYKSLREALGLLQKTGCGVTIEEVWENGLVSCELNIKGVKF